MQQQYVAPLYGERSFNCPHCLAFSHQNWYQVIYNDLEERFLLEEGLVTSSVFSNPGSLDFGYPKNGFSTNNMVAVCLCYSCAEVSVWVKGEMVYPHTSVAPLPSPDMPDDVKEIYNEARNVSFISPRAATALLRLALEKLLPQVGADKAKIDTMIGQLVGQGLPKVVEKALDSMRVIGNDAVHPGTIDLRDDNEISLALFKMLNFVVDRMITQPKDIEDIYSLIPEGKLKGIDARNNKVLKDKEGIK